MPKRERRNTTTNIGDGRRPSPPELERRMLRDAANGRARILPHLEALLHLVDQEKIPHGSAAIEATLRGHVRLTTANLIALAAQDASLSEDVIQLTLLMMFAQKKFTIDWAGGHLWWSLASTWATAEDARVDR